MNLVTKLQILWLSFLFWMMAISISYWAYETPESYLEYCKFTDSQIEKVKELSKTTRDPEHYIKWIWAIASHEMGRTFKDWETKYFAGRLAQDMKYKDFNTQAEAWTKSYNKYWWKNNTASDWIKRSRYCVTENDWTPNCPNRSVNTKNIISQYKAENIEEVRDEREPIIKSAKPKIKTICRKESFKVDKWEYLKITFAGKIRQWITNLWAWDEVYICKDVK